MSKKEKKGKGKGKGKSKIKNTKDVDWAAEENFRRERSMIYIEHSTECPIFTVKAQEFQEFVQTQIPERIFQLVRNQNGKLVPRSGAFEIGFSQTARTSIHNIWTGLEKGPPRRDKFPNFESLLPAIRVVLKKFYADLTEKPEELLEEAPPPPDSARTTIDEATEEEN